MYDPFKKVTVKVYSQNITNCIIDKKVFKVKQLYNSHSDVVLYSKEIEE